MANEPPKFSAGYEGYELAIDNAKLEEKMNKLKEIQQKLQQMATGGVENSVPKLTFGSSESAPHESSGPAASNMVTYNTRLVEIAQGLHLLVSNTVEYINQQSQHLNDADANGGG